MAGFKDFLRMALGWWERPLVTTEYVNFCSAYMSVPSSSASMASPKTASYYLDVPKTGTNTIQPTEC